MATMGFGRIDVVQIFFSRRGRVVVCRTRDRK
jgi:hypothetical protein